MARCVCSITGAAGLLGSPALGDPEGAAVNERRELSPMQKRVVTLFHQGLRPEEIATSIGLRPKTVRGYLQIVLNRLGHQSLQELWEARERCINV